MTTHIVTFSTEDMSCSAELCIESAKRNGIDSHSQHNPGNIMHNESMHPYWPAMDRMFNYERGCGFWSWKPLIIHADMGLLKNGDTLIYADAGVEFINDVNHIISRMDQDIFLFGNNWEHAHWCKRDVIEEVWPYNETESVDYPTINGSVALDERGQLAWSNFGKQAQASVIVLRVSGWSRWFVAEWLKWCLFEGGRLIDDSPSRAPNHPEFRENRHDQAILTTMAYREGIRLHYWPARYNMDHPNGGFVYEKLLEYAEDNYPPLFHHHRKRNHEFQQIA